MKDVEFARVWRFSQTDAVQKGIFLKILQVRERRERKSITNRRKSKEMVTCFYYRIVYQYD